MAIYTAKGSRFILDSGATHHIVNSKKLLYNYLEFKHLKQLSTKHKQHIYCANGAKLNIIGTGDISPTIRNVLHVPGALVNIISVAKLTEGGNTVSFTDSEVLLNGVSIGKLDEHLYSVKPVLFNSQRDAHVELQPETVAAPKTRLETDEAEFADEFVLHEYELMKNDLTASDRKLDLLHRRFGHTDVAEIQRLIHTHAVDGIELKPHQVRENFHCDACHIAKMTKKSRDPSLKFRLPNRKAVEHENFFNLVHADLIGPLSVQSIHGCYFGISFTEVQSRYRWFYAIRTKDDAINAFKTFLAEVSSYNMGFSVKMLKTDNGGEFTSNDFAQLLVDQKIAFRTTTPHTPSSNAFSERFNRVLGERTRAMLKGGCLPNFLWDECMQATTYLYNRCIAPNSEDKTPFEQLLGVKPNCGHLRAYGCVAYAYNFDVGRKKLDDRGIKGVLIGYDQNSSGYLLYVPGTRKIIRSGHVAFNESKTYYVIKDKDPALSNQSAVPNIPTVSDVSSDTTETTHVSEFVEVEFQHEPEVTIQEPRPQRTKQTPKHLQNFVSFANNHEPDQISPVEIEPEDIDMLFYDFDSSFDAPISFADIAHWDDRDLWYEGVLEENKSLAEHQVFIEIDPSMLSPGTNIVKCRYILKRKANGRYKARLVAKGFSQKLGVDYNKTFAPVVSKASLRILLSLAAVHDWEIHQLDVKTAFLYGELKEDIYVEAPDGLGYPAKTILKLNKSLYGLKQAPREWNSAINRWLVSQGWKRLSTDRGVYIHTAVDGTLSYLALYVDDMLIFGPNINFIKHFKNEINKKFQIDDLGEVGTILGMEVTRDRQNRLLRLSQIKYLEALSKKFCAPLNREGKNIVPITKSTLQSTFNSESASMQSLPSHIPYRSLLGSILYANTCTRPDISFATSLFGSFNTDTKMPHWRGLQHLLKYVTATKDLAIEYGGLHVRDANQLTVYADADFACKYSPKRKSRSGFILYLNNGPVLWHSSFQTKIAQSTSEAELYSLFDAVQEAKFLKNFLSELGFEQNVTTCYEDNTGCIDWITKPRASTRMKAIELKYYSIRDDDEDEGGTFRFVHIPTQSQRADLLTKQMDNSSFSPHLPNILKYS